MTSWLGPDLMPLFSAQQNADQRHGLEVARHVLRSGKMRPELVVAAALHDVGKRHSEMGAVLRSVATILMLLHMPMTKRMSDYVRHGELGAADLEATGVAPLAAIEFARHHQHGRPDGFPQEDWKILRSADLNL